MSIITTITGNNTAVVVCLCVCWVGVCFRKASFVVQMRGCRSGCVVAALLILLETKMLGTIRMGEGTMLWRTGRIENQREQVKESGVCEIHKRGVEYQPG